MLNAVLVVLILAAETFAEAVKLAKDKLLRPVKFLLESTINVELTATVPGVTPWL